MADRIDDSRQAPSRPSVGPTTIGSSRRRPRSLRRGRWCRRSNGWSEKDWELARALLRRCGELGLLGVNVPEAYGGVELDKVSSLIVSEHVARSASFGATYGAQANLVHPADPDVRHRRPEAAVPAETGVRRVGRRLRAQRIGVGFRRAGRRARATRQPDGSFTLSGEKMWITNGGFADIVIVFAKVDGEHFSAFIVERAFGGVSSGKEEHKLGLHGSSTRPIILQEVPVPAANLLGEIGKGHKVAFNVLNFGRLKLGAMCTGGCKTAIGESAKYAASRRQFGQPIASFGAIRHKLGEMTARTYALESADVSDGRADRPAHGGRRNRASSGTALRARGICGRGVDCQGRRQRSRWTSCSTRTCRFTAATATSATIRPSAITATRA